MVKVVRARGLEIAYECAGEGPPLVFVHGAADDGRVWRPQLAALADLYVNDAFGTAHRAHASTEGVARLLSPAVAGLLMEALIRVARDRGLRSMEGLVLRNNPPMLRFARALGFEVYSVAEDPLTLRIVKAL